MEIEVREKDRGYEVKFVGDATIYSVAEVVRVLREVLSMAGSVGIDLSGVSDMDSAFCQVLIAARRQGEVDGKRVEIVSHSGISEEMMSYFNSFTGR